MVRVSASTARFTLFTLLLVLLPVLVQAKDDNDIVRFGGPVVVGENQNLDDVVVFGGPVTVDGTVSGDVVVFGGPVHIHGKVNGDVAVFGGPVDFGNTAVVGGDVDLFGGPLQRAPGAVVHGEISNPSNMHVFGGGMLALFAIGLIGLVPLSLILALIGYAILRDQRINTMVAETQRESGAVMLAGAAALIVLIAVFALSFVVNLKYVPIRGVVFVLFLITLFVGYTGVSSWVGRRVARNSGPLAIVLVGALIVALLQVIPLIGGVAILIFTVMALGMAISTGYGTAQGWFRL